MLNSASLGEITTCRGRSHFSGDLFAFSPSLPAPATSRSADRRHSEAKPDSELDRDRPPPAPSVDVPQAFLDKPFDVGESANVAQLRFDYRFDGADADEDPAGRAKTGRPGCSKNLPSGAASPGVADSGTSTNVPRMSW